MSYRKDPHTLDSEWIKIAEEILSRPFLSPRYRQRVEKIWYDAKRATAKTGTISLHYPNDRK